MQRNGLAKSVLYLHSYISIFKKCVRKAKGGSVSFGRCRKILAQVLTFSGCHLIFGFLGFTFILSHALQSVLEISWEHFTFSHVSISSFKDRHKQSQKKSCNSSYFSFQNTPQLTAPLTCFLWSHWLWMFSLLNCSLRANKIPNLHYSTTTSQVCFIFVNTNEDIAFCWADWLYAKLQLLHEIL